MLETATLDVTDSGGPSSFSSLSSLSGTDESESEDNESELSESESEPDPETAPDGSGLTEDSGRDGSRLDDTG